MRNSDIEWTLDLDGDVGEVDVLINYNWSPGDPGMLPSLSYPGDPPEPPEVEFVSITLLNSDETVDYNIYRLYQDDLLMQAVYMDIDDTERDDYPEWN